MGDTLTADVVSTWNQEYKGIQVQIKFWGKPEQPREYAINDGRGIWNYYLTIREAQCPEFFNDLFWYEVKTDKSEFSNPDRPTYNYYTDTTDAMNMHGGITFYKRHNSPDFKTVAAEFGCDYSHLHDEGLTYTKERVWEDARRSVDDLIEYLDNQGKALLVRCRWNGEYYPSEEIDSRGFGPVGQEKNLPKQT